MTCSEKQHLGRQHRVGLFGPHEEPFNLRIRREPILELGLEDRSSRSSANLRDDRPLEGVEHRLLSVSVRQPRLLELSARRSDGAPRPWLRSSPIARCSDREHERRGTDDSGDRVEVGIGNHARVLTRTAYVPPCASEINARPIECQEVLLCSSRCRKLSTQRPLRLQS